MPGLRIFHPHTCHRVRGKEVIVAAWLNELLPIKESFPIYSKEHKGLPLRMKASGPPPAEPCPFPNMWTALHPLECAMLLQSCPALCNTMEPTRLLCPWDSPGKNNEVGCHALLQGIFLTQELNLHLLHDRQILYHWATREVNLYNSPSHFPITLFQWFQSPLCKC